MELQEQVFMTMKIYTISCKVEMKVRAFEFKDGEQKVKVDANELVEEVRLRWTHPYELRPCVVQEALAKPNVQQKGAGKGKSAKSKPVRKEKPKAQSKASASM